MPPKIDNKLLTAWLNFAAELACTVRPYDAPLTFIVIADNTLRLAKRTEITSSMRKVIRLDPSTLTHGFTGSQWSKILTTIHLALSQGRLPCHTPRRSP